MYIFQTPTPLHKILRVIKCNLSEQDPAIIFRGDLMYPKKCQPCVVPKCKRLVGSRSTTGMCERCWGHMNRRMNPSYYAASSTKSRRSDRRGCVPPWLTQEHYREMDEFYFERDRREALTGEPHEVDHIVPIRGKDICGLHVPWNMGVLSKKENEAKGPHGWFRSKK